MFLRQLTLRNFRQFYGEQVLDLGIDPASDRNLVLIGGLNGAGKTSILEGLQLGLFGRNSRDLWSGSSYADFVAASLNRQAYQEGVRDFSLSVELESESLWGGTIVRVERTWRLADGGDVYDSLLVYQDGERLQGDREDWEHFVQKQLPPGLAPFFFFDGEKIQAIADDDDQGRLVEAVKRLLNIETVEVLETDLRTYERNLKRTAAEKDTELKQVREQLQEVRAELSNIDQHLQAHHERITQLEFEIRQSEEWIIHHGSRQALNRLQLQNQVQQLRYRKERLQGQLAEFIGTTLPQALLAPLLTQLHAQLSEEEEQERNEILHETLNTRYKHFIVALNGLDQQTLNQVQKAWQQTVAPKEAQLTLRLHRNLSGEQRRRLLAKLEGMNQGAQDQIGEIVDELDTVERELRRVLNDLKQIPEDPEFLQKEQERRSLYEEIGNLRGEIGLLEVRRRELRNRAAVLERTEAGLLDRVSLAKQSRRKLQMATSVRTALRAYVEQLTAQKLHQVTYYLSEMFRQLHQKPEYIDHFEIDPVSFKVTLKTRDGQLIDKSQLSAGEKEIYAISLLWALSKASQKDFPVVIDTPLGRLDSVHRTHFAKHYLPQANRQVILLSTDTEFDEGLYKLVKPYLARTSLIVYHPTLGRTTVEDGYFFGGRHGRALSAK